MEMKVKNLTFEKAGHPLLKEINMECKENKITVVIGGSGSGKSILLKTMNALYLPAKGEIVVGDFVIDSTMHTLFNTYRMHVGYVFSHPANHFFCKTVYKELLFALSSSGIKEQKEEKIERTLELVKLDISHLKQSPFSLSFTEQKKLSIAVALLKNPDIFIIDEPFIGMSKESQKNFIMLFKELKRTYQKTLVIATKDTDCALKIADYIYVLWNKKIRLEGTKYEVLKEERKLRHYGLRTPNLLKFSNMVYESKGVKIGYRDEINDLIKDVYRYVK